MRTGVVLERLEKTAVILKSDGTFVTVKARKDWKIGDVVQLNEINRLRSFPIAACIVFCLLLGISSQMYFTKAMVISVDDTESMELNINRFGKVISVKGYSQDMENNENNRKIKNKSYEEVLKSMIAENMQEEFEDKNSYMLITLHLSNNKQEEILKKIEVIAGITQDFGKALKIDYMVVDNNTLETAHSHGMTAGIYSKVQELAEIDSNINVEDYYHCNVNVINEQIKECHKQSGEHGHHHENSGH